MWYNLTVRDLFKVFLLGIALFCTLSVNAANVQKKTVLVLPDNIVTDSLAVDSFIYDSTAEFFSNEIINLLNRTDYITSPTVSDERKLLKSNPSYMVPARDLTNKFKTSYNINYPLLNKVAKANNQQYVLLLTSTIDSENYILRRTLWDFLNIAGAAVIDPAYKINTYAVLVDTKNNSVLWSNTFYKTISVVESRILTRGPSPQTEQLQKIRDYSRMLCPEIAENVQVSVLTEDEYLKESYKIYYDMGNFDNIFTKKYRRWYKEGKKDIKGFGRNTSDKYNSAKEHYNESKARRAEKKRVKAEQYTETYDNPYKEIKTKDDNPTKIIQPMDFEDQSLFEPVNMKRIWKNKLYGEYDPDRPDLRDYDRL